MSVIRRRRRTRRRDRRSGAQGLCRRLNAADAFIIASPEYNASMPGHLKNSIDWASRFRPQPFNGKQALLLSASPSMVGGNRGLWSLRVPFEHLGARIYPDMFSLAQAHQAFSADGALADTTLQQRFESTIGCFIDLVEAAKHYPTLKKQWVEFLGEHPDARSIAWRISAGGVTSCHPERATRAKDLLSLASNRRGIAGTSGLRHQDDYSTVTDFARLRG